LKVLVVDDDEKIVKVLVTYLTKEGYMTETAMNGRSAVEMARQWQPDVVLLDVMLPELDGWDVCKEIRRASDVPIIMLTARDAETDRIIGLEIGADDYVTKPFSPRELIARIRAILRRVKPEERRNIDGNVLRVGEIILHQHNHTLTVQGKKVELTPTEHKMLELFLTHPGQVLSRLQLIENVQGYAFEGYERTVDSHIKNLRKKLGDSYGEPRYIKTVYGVGYKLAGDSRA
jgi:DNA-binding response OmpR family regulator